MMIKSSHTKRSTRHTSGFSLIELMIVVVIVSILAAIAVPSYLSSIRQSRRTDAKSALLDLAAREERWFATNNGTYTTVATNLGYSGTWPVVVGSGYYQIQQPTVTTGSTTAVATFTITAVPVPGSDQANKDLACTSFTIDNTGKQSATGSDVNPSINCWNGGNQ
jgi:type IV pilus assembly protein PilE